MPSINLKSELQSDYFQIKYLVPFLTAFVLYQKKYAFMKFDAEKVLGEGGVGFRPSPSTLGHVMLDFNYIWWVNRGLPNDHL